MRTIEPFVGEDVRPIPLINMGLYILPGTRGTISGWGIVVRIHIRVRLERLMIVCGNES